MAWHKVLKYRILTPDFMPMAWNDINSITLKYKIKKMLCIGGYISYGELELFELPPEIYEPHLMYCGWRDATDDEELEIRWRNMTVRKLLKEGKYI